MKTHNEQSDNQKNNRTAEAIAKALNSSVEQLDAGTLTALGHARESALARQKQLVVLNNGNGILRLAPPYSSQQWMATIILLGALLITGLGYWHHFPAHDSTEHDISHLDIAILTDDLPMDVFVD